MSGQIQRAIPGAAYAAYRPDWLALHDEQVLEPGLPIIDSHHHVWDSPRPRYMMQELLADASAGHNVRATVFVDCRSMYRADGPADMRSLGEVEFVNGIAAMSASGQYGPARLCAGIVGFGSLHLGKRAGAVLEALLRIAGERFKGVRQVAACDPDPAVATFNPERPPGLLLDARFREGFACLAPLGLSFDAFVFQTQLGELIELARAFPDTQIVTNHLGGPLGIGPYAGRQAEMFAAWKPGIAELARCPNVWMKLGGLGLVTAGFNYQLRDSPPDSATLASAYRPYIETCIELFGPRRCMFESNFPPDKAGTSYRVLWNAFKRITAGASAEDKDRLYFDSAREFYRMQSAVPKAAG